MIQINYSPSYLPFYHLTMNWMQFSVAFHDSVMHSKGFVLRKFIVLWNASPIFIAIKFIVDQYKNGAYFVMRMECLKPFSLTYGIDTKEIYTCWIYCA